MQPLFDPDPFLVDDVAVATLRVFVAPSGTVSRYEIIGRSTTGNLEFHRVSSNHEVFDTDGGYVLAEATLRKVVRDALQSAKAL